jgi:hypothetical protein
MLSDGTDCLWWWVRIAKDLEYYGPFRLQIHAKKFADRWKCSTEILQDALIDGSYRELTGGDVEKKASRYIVMHSGRVVPFSKEAMYEWLHREYGI